MRDEKWYSSHKFRENLGYEILKKKKNKNKVQKNYPKVRIGKMKTKACFFSFKRSLNFRAHALQSKLNKVSISNFVKFRLQSMSSKIERAIEKN